MRRRDFFKGGVAAFASSLLPASAFAARNRPVTWAPYQNLDLDPQDMASGADIARIIQFAKEFIPQTNTGRPAYDPRHPDKPGTERRLEGCGKRIQASEMSISVPNTGIPSAKEKEAQGLPDYVAQRDGGIRAIFDPWYGSWATNWTLAALVAKGALSPELRPSGYRGRAADLRGRP